MLLPYILLVKNQKGGPIQQTTKPLFVAMISPGFALLRVPVNFELYRVNFDAGHVPQPEAASQ